MNVHIELDLSIESKNEFFDFVKNLIPGLIDKIDNIEINFE